MVDVGAGITVAKRKQRVKQKDRTELMWVLGIELKKKVLQKQNRPIQAMIGVKGS